MSLHGHGLAAVAEDDDPSRDLTDAITATSRSLEVSKKWVGKKK
jgi:hypothetical protein